MNKNLSVAVFVALLSFAACGGSSDAPVESGNGVNDVKKACELRGAWKRSADADCSSCFAFALSEPCPCSPVAGKCHAQAHSQNAEIDCEAPLAACVRDCKADCVCVDTCYAGHDRCRVVTSARDGCVAEVCDSACR